MRVHVKWFLFVAATAVICSGPARCYAQSESTPPPPPPPVAAAAQSDPDLDLVVEEPDFSLAALPTTLRMPRGKFAFRLTHRFTRPIAQGDVGDFFADFFGFDSAARIGFEVRYGILPGTEFAVHRTNDRSIQFTGQHEIMRYEPDKHFLTVHALGAIEGGNNFSEDFGETFGAVVSLPFRGWGALYAEPIFVVNSNIDPFDEEGDQNTFMIGFGGRWRLGKTSKTYVVAEYVPRLAGYRPGVDHASFAIEKRAGGHLFQFNVSNDLGTTFRQIAESGPRNDWFVGFNLTRKFW